MPEQDSEQQGVVADQVVVVTGGASGIGAALVRRFAAEGAAAVVVVDRDAAGAAGVADEVAATGVAATAVVADLATAEGVAAAVADARAAHGRVDVWCSNAGIAVGGSAAEADDDGWQRSWDVNVMAGVRAARELVPEWLERGGGTFVSTVSASGLLNHLFAAPYGATKAAALSFAEHLAMTHGDDGVRVLAVCPQGVRTPMLEQDTTGFLDAGAIEPEDVAAAVVDALRSERQFLVLPHREVADHASLRGQDHDRWIGGMRKLRRGLLAHLAGAGEGAATPPVADRTD
ncbi:MAG: SDR family NAD(P)-dependent oxidoreductase [Actinomycetes bacterium]